MNSSKYEYEKKVFVVNEWINLKEKNVFIFSGLDKLDTKKFNDKQTKSVTNINHFIYETDTIETIRYKIAKMCMKNENVKDIYMWGTCSISSEERILFVQSLFKNQIKLEKAGKKKKTKKKRLEKEGSIV